MKKTLALILAMLMLMTALYGCGNDPAPSNPNSDNSLSTPDEDENSDKTGGEAENGGAVVTTSLPGAFEIAATEPHFYVGIPDWHAESYGYGFALTENGSSGYAIAVACSYESSTDPLEESFPVLYNDSFNGILMQYYRAIYAEYTPATTEVTLADGTPALFFEDMQPANDYGTETSFPVYGYSFNCDGFTFIIACIVTDDAAADDAKRAEMQGYVDEMVYTVKAAQ